MTLNLLELLHDRHQEGSLFVFNFNLSLIKNYSFFEFSSGSSISPSTSSSSSGSAKSAVSECLGSWLNYLQTLNNLVASGYRLTQVFLFNSENLLKI